MFTAIVARRASDFVIGTRGVIPWYIPEDLKFFREETSKTPTTDSSVRNICIMGRKTYQSIGMPTLPNRLILVISDSAKVAVPADVTKEQVKSVAPWTTPSRR